MLKSLYPRIDWGIVRVVGFDMDGTLYDEADFIRQVYRPIAEVLSGITGVQPQEMHASLFGRWVEKGSSYNRIYEEALAGAGIEGVKATDAVAACLDVFRGFTPILALSEGIRSILTASARDFPLFLVSDGSCNLQRRKFAALGLEQWFQPRNVGITGCLGSGFSKPDTRIIERIEALAGIESSRQVVYFGDRDPDEQFAAAAGFQFVKVRCMQEVQVAGL